VLIVLLLLQVKFSHFQTFSLRMQYTVFAYSAVSESALSIDDDILLRGFAFQCTYSPNWSIFVCTTAQMSQHNS
jgi:hypothetical protein